MENHLKRSENVGVASVHLEHFMLSPEDNALSILSSAENACENVDESSSHCLRHKKSEAKKWRGWTLG